MADEEAEGLSTLPITVTITKSGAPGAMYIEADAGREGISLTNVTVHEKAMAEQAGAEGEHERSNAYAGPRKSGHVLLVCANSPGRPPRARRGAADCFGEVYGGT